MLFVCRTPPKSDLFDAPARSRLIVVFLLPKACRKANGNSTKSNACSARVEMASSISTAFIWSLPQRTFQRFVLRLKGILLIDRNGVQAFPSRLFGPR